MGLGLDYAEPQEDITQPNKVKVNDFSLTDYVALFLVVIQFDNDYLEK